MRWTVRAVCSSESGVARRLRAVAAGPEAAAVGSPRPPEARRDATSDGRSRCEAERGKARRG